MGKQQPALSSVCFTCRRLLARPAKPSNFAVRALSTETIPSDSQRVNLPPKLANIDLATVSSPRTERQLVRSRVFPIGSRRRRAALQSSRNIPFEQLPYQCFQEARKVLQDDRAEKLIAIAKERERIRAVEAEEITGEHEEWMRQNRLRSMRKYLEYLKIQADINDPLVKKRFEDGQGDMTRPIYRHLAERKWRAPGGKYLIAEQRIKQMHVVPDILPSFDLTADVSLYMRGTKPASSNMVIPRTTRTVGGGRVPVQPGEFVASAVSERPPRIEVQVFDKGPRMVTVAVVDPDVPNMDTDGFEYRCHFLAINVPVAPEMTTVRMDTLEKNQVILPWSAPYAQKGSPYHRLAVMVFEQPKREDGQQSDATDIITEEAVDDATVESTENTQSTTQPATPSTPSGTVHESGESAAEISTSTSIHDLDTPSSNSPPSFNLIYFPIAIGDHKRAPTPTTHTYTTVSSTSTSTPHGSHRPHRTLTLPCTPSAGYIPMQPAKSRVHARGGRNGFIMRSFVDRYELKPIGATLFRVQWDEWMDGVMRRSGVEGVGEELRRAKPESLPYKKKDGRRFRGAGGSGLGRN